MNALRHGFASAATVASRETVGTGEYECVNAVDLARSKILSEIDGLLQQPPSETLDNAVRQLGALERYAARNFSQIKEYMQKLK